MRSGGFCSSESLSQARFLSARRDKLAKRIIAADRSTAGGNENGRISAALLAGLAATEVFLCAGSWAASENKVYAWACGRIA